MTRFYHSLIFKIGVIIIITEAFALSVVGVIYIDQFANQIDRRFEEQAQIPGLLINAGLLKLDSVSDQQTMEQLIGAPLLDGLIVGVNNYVFISFNPDYIGKNLRDLPNITPDLLDAGRAKARTIIQRKDVSAVSPIFASDGQTVRFYCYIKASTLTAESQKAEIRKLFIIGSVATVLFTSLIIFLSFQYAIFDRISKVLKTLKRIETGERSDRVTGPIIGDEIGSLQQGVNSMATQLEEIINTLEERVAARTRDLQIAVNVSKQITTVLDVDKLMQQVVTLAVQGFDLCSASIYIIDGSSLQLVHTAGSDMTGVVVNEKGQVIIPIDAEANTIARAARTREAVIVNDVMQSPVVMPLNVLAKTRSELAIPMLLGSQLLGVFDLQADQPDRFSDEDLRVLTTLAEQIAIAVRNAQLFAASQAARISAEEANEAKSDFLARMSHEIRTPLNAVTGLTNIVLKSDLTTEQRDYLNKVQLASNNLLEVINDILDFSKVDAGRLELARDPFDLDVILEQLADLFTDRVSQKDLELIFFTDPKVPKLLVGDSGRLVQILTNLIENAVKFTDQGEIVVGVEPGDQAEKLPGQAPLKFRVSDTGLGVSADVLPTLFEPFTQADSYLTREHEGTGLGLSICQRLVELMGGRIWVESTIGQGSTFIFTVRLPTQAEEKIRSSLPADLHGLKVLVVDDSATARQVLVDLLESFSFNVSAVDSGLKALEAISRATPVKPYQLVLLDWKMPGMDGIKTAKAIHNDPELHRPPIIILVTAHGRELVQEHLDTAAIDTMLLKPVKPSQLFNTIMELLGQPEVGVLHRGQETITLLTQRLAGRRVLVVEDSELNRDVAVALLEDTGLTVETAENGRVAVDKVTESPKGYYDAVFMDIQMPVMNGYQATSKIREFEKQQGATSQKAETQTPIIALTAHALKGEKEKCLAADMDDYLAKPIDEQDLHRMLVKWIAP